MAALWELAGLKESAPAAEKGYSMLTAAVKKKMDVQRAMIRRLRRRWRGGRRETADQSKRDPSTTQTATASQERSRKENASAVPVGMTGVALGASGAKVASIATKLAKKNPETSKTSGVAKKHAAGRLARRKRLS